MDVRTISLKVHRWCGLAMALFLLNAGLSGATLVFRDEIDNWLNADAVQVMPSGAVLPVADMIAALAQQRPETKVKRFFTGHDANRAWRFQLTPRGAQPLAINEVWLDPYSGQVTGERLAGAARLDRRHLMPMIMHWHDSLYLEKPGLTLIGSVALVWLLSSLVGIYLSMPRAGSLLKAFVIKRGASTFKFVYDAHRVVGLVTCLVLLGSAFSATYLGLPEQFKAVLKLVSRPTEPLLKTLPERRVNQPAVDMDQAILIAQAALPGAALRGLSPHPDKGVYQVRLRLDGDINAGNGTGRVLVDMQSGAVLEARSFRNAGSAGDTLIAWMYPLHSGQAFGTPGRVVIVCIGLFPGLLGLSGAWIWWRRRQTLAARRAPSRAAA
jgi:uncharacterized iron-regulated membrane protein